MPIFAVVKTAFHGGGIVSRHRSLAAAARSADRWASKHCTCGCTGVVALVPAGLGLEYGIYGATVDRLFDDLPYASDAHARSLAK